MMHMRILTLLICCQVALPLIADTSLDEMDKNAPTINHVPAKKPVTENEPFIISASVKDDNRVSQVIVFHRIKGQQNYLSTEMTPLGKQNIFSATLSAETIKQPGVEYYIQAFDAAGNSTAFGLSFDPKLLLVSKPALNPNPQAQPKPKPSSTLASKPNEALNPKATQINLSQLDPKKTENPWYKNKWLWIGIGVVTIAAASSSGSGGDGSPPPTSSLATGDDNTGEAEIIAPVP